MPQKVRILLVEDDASLGYVIKDSLEEKGYEVVHATDGNAGWLQFSKHYFDLCLLDVMMPLKDGFTLATQIRRKNTHIPILFITAKNMQEDKISGFKAGGDDYITKPFSLEELILRIEVFLKRTKGPDQDELIFQLGNAEFDYPNLTVKGPKIDMRLTQKEADLLRFFCLNPNRVVKRDEVLTRVWGKDDYFLGRSMDVFITKIRKYLKEETEVEIQTIHGVGFRFNNPSAKEETGNSTEE